MAKKKGRPPTRSTRTGSRVASSPVVKPEPASPGGPNRLARKEEARRQRVALQRKMGRRRTMRVIGAVVAVLLVASGISIYLVLKPSAAEAAGCTSLRTIKPYNPASEDRSHVGVASSPVSTPPALSTYPSVPPTSGPHLPPGEQLPAGVYSQSPNPWSSIHSLEHGAAIIWYSPTATGPQLTKIKDHFLPVANHDHVIVAPYNYPSQGKAGRLPKGKQMALVFWHHLQLCDSPSLAVAQGFAAKYAIPSTGIAPPGYPKSNGAPEPGSSLNGTPPAFKP
jgi:Protein of unknown function (DUF3105)